MLRLAMLISGGGTTMEQILLACDNGPLKGLVEPVLVIASNDNIGGIQRAIDAGFPAGNIKVIGRKGRTKANFAEQLISSFSVFRVDVVGQFGWTEYTPEDVIDWCNQRQYPIINQHPGAIDPGHPGFGGKGMVGPVVHEALIRYLHAVNPLDSAWFAEVTCHFVTMKYDDGPIIFSARVPVRRDDTAETLQERALSVEWATQIAGLMKLALGNTNPVVRETRLIPPENISNLLKAKAEAKEAYPFHG